MEALVSVRLGSGDVILESSDDWTIEVVHDAKGVVAVGLGRHDDAQRHQIVNLFKAQAFQLHFSPDARCVFDPPLDFDQSHASDVGRTGDFQLPLLCEGMQCRARSIDRRAHVGESGRLEDLQRSILEICRPYLGLVVGEYSEWHPLVNRNRLFPEDLDETDPWQFKNVRVV